MSSYSTGQSITELCSDDAFTYLMTLHISDGCKATVQITIMKLEIAKKLSESIFSPVIYIDFPVFVDESWP